MSGNSSGMPSQSNTPKPNSTSETKCQYPLSRPTYNYGKKPGHLVSECLKLTRGPSWSYIAHLSIFVTYMVYQGQAINSFQIRHTLGFVTKICLQIFFFVFGQWS